MTRQEVEAHFNRSGDSYVFVRWERPIASIVFAVEHTTLAVFKSAIEAMVKLANHMMAETDPELGLNLMAFSCRDWNELLGVLNFDKLLRELNSLVALLTGPAANQYRIFRFDANGAITAYFVFLRLDKSLADLPLQTRWLLQALQTSLLWSEAAFAKRSPLAILPGGKTVLRPEIVNLVRSAHDPVLSVMVTEPSHALRLSARITASKAAE